MKRTPLTPLRPACHDRTDDPREALDTIGAEKESEALVEGPLREVKAASPLARSRARRGPGEVSYALLAIQARDSGRRADALLLDDLLGHAGAPALTVPVKLVPDDSPR